ncbi:solute carrier family 17 member 9b [Leucoraja erinacea]|uniref:solute carrier family 17 member 9b n=1 Tax=Leucoraja erinaceus TaxID=7782 RepID=UPI0024590352|nr:solute carrier family 17 member 9b [Leucoraja erinacea]
MAFAAYNEGDKNTNMNLIRPGDSPNEMPISRTHAHGTYWSKSEAKSWVPFLFMGTCLLYCARVTLPICVSAMAEQYEWDKKQSGVVLGSFFWGYCLTQIIGGYISDRLGGAKILMLSTCAWGFVVIFTPVIVHQSSSPIVLLTASRFLMGLLQGVFYPSLMSLFSIKVRESDRAFTSSSVCTGSQVGTLLLGAVGSVLLHRYGWESVFYFSGLPSLLWGVCMWKYFLKGQDQIISLESLGNGLVNSKNSKVPWRKLFQSTAVWAVIVAHICLAGTFFCLLSWMPTFFHDLFPESKGWVFNVVPWAVAIPFSLFGGLLTDHLIKLGFDTAKVRKIMTVFAMGLSSIFTKLLSYSGNYYQAVIFLSASLGLQTFNHSGVSVNVQDLAPSCAGSLFGIMNTGGALCGVAFVYLAGYLIETSGSWPSVFNFICVVNTFGLSFFLFFGQATRIDI